eukprot:1951972-Rhodomonas_salina.1
MFANNSKCDRLRASGGSPFYIDFSVKYIFGHKIPKKMKQTIPKSLHDRLRFVVVLREPIARDRSWVEQIARITGRTMNDETYVEDTIDRLAKLRAGKKSELSHGFYDEHLRFWYDEFRTDQ